MDHGGLMASVVLDEPSLGLSPVLVTEIFRCPMSAARSLAPLVRWRGNQRPPPDPSGPLGRAAEMPSDISGQN